jgi:hypothetical protein
MADDRIRLGREDVERIAASLTPTDARLFRAYYAFQEERLATWTAESFGAITAALVEIRRLADDAHATGSINGKRIDRLSTALDAIPGRLSATMDAHESRLMEHLRPVHEAAQRSMSAEAARSELDLERERIELDARRKEVERQHTGAMGARDMLMHSLKTYPWFWVLVWLLAGSMGLSLSELGHLVGIGAPAPHVEAGP